MSARELILGRIRDAVADVPRAEPPAWEPDAEQDDATMYARSGSLDSRSLVELLAERCADYRATVTRCENGDSSIAVAVRNAFTRHSVDALVTPPDLPPGWVPAEVPARVDAPPLPLAELDSGVAVLTGCALAIALTGTIALDAGPAQGRRALTLVPDVHICVVRAAQIVFGVPEAVDALGRAVREARRPLTLISGPSATSDIELVRVEGVHGPRRLEIILAG